MRAAVYKGAQRVSVETVPDPEPRPDGLVVEIARCGICGSDVSMTSGGPFDYPVGKCFGHEFSGTVVAVGRDVGGWKVGDRAACLPKSGCGRCELCRRSGSVLLCPGGHVSGFGFAEYAAVHPDAAVRLPQSLSLADGALVEPMACGLRALRRAGMRADDRVLVLGAGAMALSVIWWARRLGAAKIVAASNSPHRREACLTFGADAVLGRYAADDPEALQAALGGPPHIVAECVGRHGALGQALREVMTGGVVVSMGMHTTLPEQILPAALAFREAQIIFPLGYTAAEFEETARAFDAGGFSPEAMVGQVLPLEALPAAMAGRRIAAAGSGKIHIDPRMSE